MIMKILSPQVAVLYLRYPALQNVYISVHLDERGNQPINGDGEY